MSNISKRSIDCGSCYGEITEYTITNKCGVEVKLIDIGAAIHSISVPDKCGDMRDVTLGFKEYRSYFGDGAALGKSVGRYANRVGNSRFTLDGKEYHLTKNHGEHHIHGGVKGFQNVIWNSEVVDDKVVFTYHSADGEEGYPAPLTVEALYHLTEENELHITYRATTPEKTIINLTNHTYFNLNGEGRGNILNHEMQLNADNYLPTCTTQIPTGEIISVVNTPMDFTTAKTIGRDIDNDFEALKIGRGYDHCWLINNYKKGVITPAAELYSSDSGIMLQILTTQPAVQVYSGNWLDGCGVSKMGSDHINRGGVAIECQNYPDAINKPHFPNSILSKGEEYNETIIFKFSGEF